MKGINDFRYFSMRLMLRDDWFYSFPIDVCFRIELFLEFLWSEKVIIYIKSSKFRRCKCFQFVTFPAKRG